MRNFYVRFVIGTTVALTITFNDQWLVPFDGIWVVWHLFMSFAYGLVAAHWWLKPLRDRENGRL